MIHLEPSKPGHEGEAVMTNEVINRTNGPVSPVPFSRTRRKRSRNPGKCTVLQCTGPKADIGGDFPGAALSRYDAPKYGARV